MDLAGQPIPGAVLRSDQSCSHAPPSFVGIANEDGLLDLASWPPSVDQPEGRIRAPGFRAFRGLHTGSLEWAFAANGEAQLFLPRVAPIKQLILDEHGAPAVGKRIVMQQDSWQVARVGIDGFATLRSRGETPGDSLLFLPSARMQDGVQMPLARHARTGSGTARSDAWSGAGWQGETALVNVRFAAEHAKLAATHPPEVAFQNHLGYDDGEQEEGQLRMPLGFYTGRGPSWWPGTGQR